MPFSVSACSYFFRGHSRHSANAGGELDPSAQTSAGLITSNIEIPLQIAAQAFVFLVLLWTIPAYIGLLVVGAVIPGIGAAGAGRLMAAAMGAGTSAAGAAASGAGAVASG